MAGGTFPRVNRSTLGPAVHARITPDPESGCVATCEEIAVVAQGEALDEVTANLGTRPRCTSRARIWPSWGSLASRPSS
jgi:hypothetical protein